jgi:hypothetical protein
VIIDYCNLNGHRMDGGASTVKAGLEGKRLSSFFPHEFSCEHVAFEVPEMSQKGHQGLIT